jgi:hypothetical protein
MKMTKFEINITINQPPDIVDKAFMEPGNAVQWTSGLVKFEVVKGKPGEIGAIAHLHYLEKGRSHIMEDVLEYCEPGKRYVSRVSGGGMNARVETILNPTDHGTDVIMFWSGTSNSFYVRLILPFLRGMIMRRAKADLRTFKSLVEVHGVHFPEKTVSS